MSAQPTSSPGPGEWDRPAGNAGTGASSAPVPPDPLKFDEMDIFRRQIFAATPRVFLTYAILAINIVVFVLMVVSGVSIFTDSVSNGDLVAWGSNYGPLTITGDWWRLLTSVFVHIGLLHIAMNMWVLWDVGVLVERLYGNLFFAVVYLISGILGSLASVWWHTEILSAGASGAIFGLYGALLAFFIVRRSSIPSRMMKSVSRICVFFILFNVAYGSWQPQIDNAAHLGGLLGGFLVGLAGARPLPTDRRRAQLFPRLAAALLVSAALISLLVHFLPISAYAPYFQWRDTYVVEEEKALALEKKHLASLSDANRRTVANAIESDCIPVWNRLYSMGEGIELPDKRSNLETIREQRVLVAFVMEEALKRRVKGLRRSDPALTAVAIAELRIGKSRRYGLKLDIAGLGSNRL
ncbi:MAG: hypothetical protein C0404_13090 [Verrucomicrobia bacterium]|nr:hypothetical protein [Verrucomicrobiota bacterium]